ncbi:MAG TPA: hypothetical protein EYP59_22920 [Thiotrichaceae bacterium]|nr:hypothetical protein [Thiotrichaceae bacterium]
MSAIKSEELITHPAILLNQTDSAGGIMNDLLIISSDTIGTVIEDITEPERLLGANRHYKLYEKIANPDNQIFKEVYIYISTPLTSDYILSLSKGNFFDVWADAKNARRYGTAMLKNATSIAATTLVINTRGSDFNHFQQNDIITIIDQANPDDLTGHQEFARIQSIQWNGDEATLQIQSLYIEEGLRYAYNIQRTLNGVDIPTRISSCIEYGDVTSNVSIVEKNTIEGTTNVDAIQINNIAGITQVLTFTFESATDFQVSSNLDISLPSGQKITDYEPYNPNYDLPYLTISPEFWLGNWAAGESLKISTTPSACPYWVIVDIPPNSSDSDKELFDINISGNSSSS